MLQLRGLIKKDWTIVKGYMFLVLLLDFIVPFGAASLLSIDFGEGVLVFAGTLMALHLLLPLILLGILFTKEMDRPDIFFHSTASIHKINASKFLIAVLSTAVSLLWAGIVALSAVLLAPELSGAAELIPSGAYFVVTILFFSIQTAIIFYFFLTLFFSMQPKIGGFAYIVTIGLFFFSVSLWDKIQSTETYQSLTGFWVISLSDSELFSNFAMHLDALSFSAVQSANLPISQFLVIGILLFALYLFSSYWFEKKVRV